MTSIPLGTNVFMHRLAILLLLMASLPLPAAGSARRSNPSHYLLQLLLVTSLPLAAAGSARRPNPGHYLLLLLLVTTLPLAAAGSARRPNPGHYLRLFDIPELCPHLSFVIPWTALAGGQAAEKEVVLLEQGPLSIRQNRFFFII